MPTYCVQTVRGEDHRDEQHRLHQLLLAVHCRPLCLLLPSHPILGESCLWRLYGGIGFLCLYDFHEHVKYASLYGCLWCNYVIVMCLAFVCLTCIHTVTVFSFSVYVHRQHMKSVQSES